MRAFTLDGFDTQLPSGTTWPAPRSAAKRSYSLEQAGEALRALPAGHTQGKVGLTIS